MSSCNSAHTFDGKEAFLIVIEDRDFRSSYIAFKAARELPCFGGCGCSLSDGRRLKVRWLLSDALLL